MKERILRNIMSSISTNTDPTSNVNLLNQKVNGAQTISNNDVFSVYNWKEELESFKIYLARIQIFFPRHICIFSINLPVNSKLKRNVIFFWSEGGGGSQLLDFTNFLTNLHVGVDGGCQPLPRHAHRVKTRRQLVQKMRMSCVHTKCFNTSWLRA